LSPEGHAVHANRHMLEYLGTKAEDMQTRAIGQAFHPNHRPAVLILWQHSAGRLPGRSPAITRLRALFTRQGTSKGVVDLNQLAGDVIALSGRELQRSRVAVSSRDHHKC
jgi:hypothetical protein